MLEAVPLDATHSFVHMSYSYAYGMAARIAIELYPRQLHELQRDGYLSMKHAELAERTARATSEPKGNR